MFRPSVVLAWLSLVAVSAVEPPPPLVDVSSSCPFEAGQFQFEITINSSPDETRWSLKDDVTGELVVDRTCETCGYFQYSTTLNPFQRPSEIERGDPQTYYCLEEGKSYTIALTDDSGDGLVDLNSDRGPPGGVKLFLNGCQFFEGFGAGKWFTEEISFDLGDPSFTDAFADSCYTFSPTESPTGPVPTESPTAPRPTVSPTEAPTGPPAKDVDGYIGYNDKFGCYSVNFLKVDYFETVEECAELCDSLSCTSFKYQKNSPNLPACQISDTCDSEQLALDELSGDLDGFNGPDTIWYFYLFEGTRAPTDDCKDTEDMFKVKGESEKKKCDWADSKQKCKKKLKKPSKTKTIKKVQQLCPVTCNKCP